MINWSKAMQNCATCHNDTSHHQQYPLYDTNTYSSHKGPFNRPQHSSYVNYQTNYEYQQPNQGFQLGYQQGFQQAIQQGYRQPQQQQGYQHNSFNPGFGSYQQYQNNRRFKRQAGKKEKPEDMGLLDDLPPHEDMTGKTEAERFLYQTERKRNEAKVCGMFCVTKQLGFMHDNNKPDYDNIKEYYRNLNTLTQEEKDEFVDNIDTCRAYSESIPARVLETKVLGKEYGQTMMFFKCTLKMEINTCMEKEVKQNYYHYKKLLAQQRITKDVGAIMNSVLGFGEYGDMM